MEHLNFRFGARETTKLLSANQKWINRLLAGIGYGYSITLFVFACALALSHRGLVNPELSSSIKIKMINKLANEEERNSEMKPESPSHRNPASGGSRPSTSVRASATSLTRR